MARELLGRRGESGVVRRKRTRSAGVAAGVGTAVLLPLLMGGCGFGEEIQREFRAAAVRGIEHGVRSIVNGQGEEGIKQIVGGILDGIFTVADPAAGGSADPRYGGSSGR